MARVGDVVVLNEEQRKEVDYLFLRNQGFLLKFFNDQVIRNILGVNFSGQVKRVNFFSTNTGKKFAMALANLELVSESPRYAHFKEDPKALLHYMGVISRPDIYPLILNTELNSTSLLNDANIKNYYRFEGNSTDTKGNNNGTDANMSYSSTGGKYTQYASFNGTSSKITIGTGACNPASNLSYTMWIYPASVSTTQDITDAGANSSEWYLSSSGVPTLAKDGVANILAANTGLTINTWQHIGVTYDGTNVTCYRNGSSDGTTTGTFTFGDTTRTISSASFFLNGRVDDFAIFNRALTGAEMLTLGTDAVGGVSINYSYTYLM